MDDTAQPGTKGNAVIAGRRTTAGAPFAHLLTVKPGDGITVTTGRGTFKYSVTHVGSAVPGDSDPIDPTHSGRLTLVTSNPPIFSTGRAYVVAKLITTPETLPMPRGLPPRSEQGLSGDSSAILPSLAWAVLLALTIMTTVASYRRWRQQIWAVYLLTTPVVLAVALVWYENLFRLLPATM
jgi:LPXTG-site transpeptidase (sortase) family protein